MPTLTSREWRLKARPVGEPKPTDFEFATTDAPEPGEGQVQVRNLWLTVDPYMRGRMNDVKSYSPPFALGETMTGGAIGEVVASNDPRFSPGDKVSSMMGWREAFTAPAAALSKLPDTNAPPQAFLGVLGMPGLTAYSGLLRIGAPKSGDTVFVSGAAGAVGSLVAQIAKIKGCYVVGSAGGADKCAWLKSIGVDEAIDYKSTGDLRGLIGALRQAAPKGVDVYFDNVGGDHLTAAIDSANVHARLVICGMISIYNASTPQPGPTNMPMIIGKRLRIEGMLVSDHGDMQAEFVRDMTGWINSGKIRYEETVFDGVDKAPEAFLSLFSGGNTGKMLVKVG
ncbi:zinc-binding dehydrogenase [bacterium]|nr:zinc-binding dehydrogenase [bacterium]